jgi:hypothetical protein
VKSPDVKGVWCFIEVVSVMSGVRVASRGPKCVLVRYRPI